MTTRVKKNTLPAIPKIETETLKVKKEDTTLQSKLNKAKEVRNKPDNQSDEDEYDSEVEFVIKPLKKNIKGGKEEEKKEEKKEEEKQTDKFVEDVQKHILPSNIEKPVVSADLSAFLKEFEELKTKTIEPKIVYQTPPEILKEFEQLKNENKNLKSKITYNDHLSRMNFMSQNMKCKF